MLWAVTFSQVVDVLVFAPVPDLVFVHIDELVLVLVTTCPGTW